MSFERRPESDHHQVEVQPPQPLRPAPGKAARTDHMPVQRRGAPTPTPAPRAPSPTNAEVNVLMADAFAPHLAVQADRGQLAGADIQATAATGFAGPGHSLPHLATIQHAFGNHDLQQVTAHVGGAAQTAATAIGADAFAMGNRVAFARDPDLHTAAHEAAHVIQQRAGVQLYGGIGAAGDAYEQHADAVADAVVRGESVVQLLTAGPHVGVAASTAVQRKEKKSSEPTLAISSKLLRSAATDLRTLAARLSPMNAAVFGGVGPAELIKALTAAARRADEASGDGREVAPDEIENLAAAGRELTAALPEALRKDAAVGDAIGVLQSAIGELATAAGAKLPAEPMVAKPGISNGQQADLVRTLLSDATVALDVDASGDLAKERKVYARAATIATDKLRIAVDLINAHVPRGSQRVALAQSVDWVSERITQLDHWTRASGAEPDAAIAALYANERTLRELTGLAPAPRAAVAAVDADTTADSIIDGGDPATVAATVEIVKVRLEVLLDAVYGAIQGFHEDAKTEKAGAKADALTDKLLTAAMSLVFGTSFPAAFAKAIVQTATGGERVAGFSPTVPEKILVTILDHAKAKLGSKGPKGSQGALLNRYTEALRDAALVTKEGILTRFEGERERLSHAHAASLRALADRIGTRQSQIVNDMTGEYILGWQTVQARAVGGIPDAPGTLGAAMRGDAPPSQFDANNVDPAVDMKIPGVLHLDFVVDRAAPRSSSFKKYGARIEGITAAHLEKLSTMSPRPVRDLHLNTIIQVRHAGMDAGIAEVVWHPDGDTVEAAWFRGSTRTTDMTEARHLKAYALGVPVDSPQVDAAGADVSARGARMIVDAVLAAPTTDVLPNGRGSS